MNLLKLRTNALPVAALAGTSLRVLEISCGEGGRVALPFLYAPREPWLSCSIGHLAELWAEVAVVASGHWSPLWLIASGQLAARLPLLQQVQDP